jgi:hypothetical protein
MGSTNNTREDYHNARLGVDRRVDDLLRRMTLAEKAGTLFQTGWPSPGAASSD